MAKGLGLGRLGFQRISAALMSDLAYLLLQLENLSSSHGAYPPRDPAEEVGNIGKRSKRAAETRQRERQEIASPAAE